MNESQYLVVLTLEEREEAEQAARSYIGESTFNCMRLPCLIVPSVYRI